MVQRWNGRGGRRMWIGVVVVIVVVQERRQSDVYLRRLQFIPLSRQGFQVKRLVQLLIQTHHWYCGSGGGVALSSNRCCQLGLGRLTNRVDCHAHSLDNTGSMVLQFCDYGGIYCDRCFLEFLGHDLVAESIPLRHLVEHCGDMICGGRCETWVKTRDQTKKGRDHTSVWCRCTTTDPVLCQSLAQSRTGLNSHDMFAIVEKLECN